MSFILLSELCDADTADIEDITVTAQKRSERAADIGVSLAVLSADELKASHVTYADQLADLQPNLSLNKPYGNSNPVLVVRGVGLQDYNVNNSPSIGLYVDEVYLPSNAMADFAVFDVDRMELMKGPQGTLWGRNSTGGAMNVVTRKPSREPSAEVEASYGNWSASGFRFAAGRALSDSLAGRLAGVIEDRNQGRFRSRTLGEEFGEFTKWAARGGLLWQPSERMELFVKLESGRHAGDSYPFAHVGIVGPTCPIANTPPGLGLADERHCTNTTTGYSDPDGDPDGGDWDSVPRTDIHGTTASMRIEFDTGATRLTSITAASRTTFERGEDDDTSPAPLLAIAYRSVIRPLSQELRWASNDEASIQWLLGLASARYEHDEFRVATLSGLFGDSLENVQLNYAQQLRTIAGFADAGISISARTTLRAGLRYTHEGLTFRGGARPGPGVFDPSFVAAVFPGLPSLVDSDRSFDDVSGRFAVEFRPAESLLIYGSLSKGFKSGGIFGGFGLTAEAFTPYNSEELYALELGTKWTTSGSRVQAEASLFIYDYRDLQGQILVTAPTGSLPLLSNVGDVRLAGIEAIVRWTASETVSGSFGVGAIDSELRDDVTTLDSLERPISLQGRELPHAPRASANATLRYLRPLDSKLSFVADADVSYRSPYEGDLPNQAHLREATTTVLVGARIGLTRNDGRWDAALWGRNLRNERYLLHGNSSGIGNDILMYSEPRTYGVEVRYRWH